MNFDEFKYLFHQGTEFQAYEKMGAHFVEENGKKGARFTVWAPHALWISVIGDFNDWNDKKDVMRNISDEGLFSVFIKDVNEYDCYKYRIITGSGDVIEKSDPYGFHFETRPANATKIYNLDEYEWQDENWLEYRMKVDIKKSPLNIYEVHLGSWKRREDGGFYNYREIAEELVPYVKKLGYTHIEIMPICEHPLDDSWGYQVTGYFAVTSRMGTPKDFMYFIDFCHQNGVGVILDWVPAHFPRDVSGLFMFDGEPCYEYSDSRKGEHKEWGTMIFDYGRNEVQSFLISSAVFWLDKFHADGLRIDAVASMLYLDYGRNEGEWMPNVDGGKENYEAVEFLRKLNIEIFKRFPFAIMAAEESTAWPKVTGSVEKGGLGFNFKWNMGWMNDILSYMETDPVFRKYKHENLTFPMCYAFSENYILPISHDEVVYGKKSLLNKMPGRYELKFAGMRVFLGFMMAHPGKKLMFMSNEFGQFSEWNFRRGIETELLQYESHRNMMEYVKKLNHFYMKNSILWENDSNWNGFEWVCADDKENNIAAFMRFDESGDSILCVFNFAPVLREGYVFELPEGDYQQVFSSDEKRFGGTGLNNEIVHTIKEECDGEKTLGRMDIPPHSAMFFRKINEGEEDDCKS